jgi:hypothetical protein
MVNGWLMRIKDRAMTNNSSMMTADRATHLKIVVVALLASVTVMIVGIAARPQVDQSATAQVVKPSKPMLATGSEANSIR